MEEEVMVEEEDSKSPTRMDKKLTSFSDDRGYGGRRSRSRDRDRRRSDRGDRGDRDRRDRRDRDRRDRGDRIDRGGDRDYTRKRRNRSRSRSKGRRSSRYND